ncbi:hypothetical protein NDA16_002872 [Ustilago loliicola]|nr:hypothetical protein NDA16_002872 [Ustilago loliicola]
MAAPGTPLNSSATQAVAVSNADGQSDPLFATRTSTPPRDDARPSSTNGFPNRAPSRAHTPGPDQMPLTIHTAAQRGDLPAIMRLVDSGRATVHDRDDDNITPLHWAAINAQLATCRYLLDHGAEVDALGGDLVASPLQWAARNGHVYVLELLCSRGADPTITDSQGFNALHLTVHSSAVMPLVFMLQQPSLSSPEGLDSTDSQGHTALMWAAYQGDAISVDILLKHGSDVHKRDSAGLTAMHWAVVKGNRLCIRLLADAKADLLAKEDSGKTPRDMAIELKSIGAYRKALADISIEEDGRRKQRTFGSRLQLTWTVILLVAQGWQIMRQMTTLEVSNLGRFGFMGGKGGQSYAGQTNFIAQHSAQARGSQPGAGHAAADRLQGIQKQQQLGGENGQIDVNIGGEEDTIGSSSTTTTTATSAGHVHPHGHSHSKLGMLKRVCSASGGWLLSIVGLDLYTRGKAGEGLKRASTAANPFDHGLLANCKDFWSKGQDLAIDYTTLYDLPAEMSPGHCEVVPFLIDTVTGGRGGRYARAGGIGRGGYSLLSSGGEEEGEDEEDDDDVAAEGGKAGGKRRWSMWSNLKNATGSGSGAGPLLPTSTASNGA